MCSFWSEVIAEREQQQRSLPRRPTIPQQAPEPDTGIGVLSTPTSVFGERQSLTPGTDFAAVLSRRHAPAEPPAMASDLLGLSPYEKAQLVILGTRAGRFDGSEIAVAAHDRAAQVAE